MANAEPAESLGAVEDDRLRLIFTCCHPALSMEARVALTLRMVGGLTVSEIARGFLVQESAMARRITRAKDKIRDARIPFRIPSEADLPNRVAGVLTVLYLVFNEGYLTSGGTSVRDDLTAEAVRLARLVRILLPDDGEVMGLLALMLLTQARRSSRVSPAGALVPISEQDRSAWDASLIDEGHALVLARIASGVNPGRYQLLAAINAVHTDAAEIGQTDWSQIVALYDRLVAIDPSPVVALNRAIALAELDGAHVGLAVVDRLAEPLASYAPLHATRADLLRRVERTSEAREAYARAIALADNAAEREYLERQRDQLG